MYTNFIFDLYGTLVDIHTDEESPSFLKGCTDFLAKAGCVYAPTEFGKIYREEIDKEEALLSDRDCPEIDIHRVFSNIVSARYDGDVKSLVDEFIPFFRKSSTEYVRLYPEIISILEFLKKNDKKVYLLSNAQELFTMPEIKDLGIYEYFDDIFISSVEGYKKPDAEFMRRLLDKHNLKIEESIMIGNDCTSDVKVADAVGMDSFFVYTSISPELNGKERATYTKLSGEPLALSDFINLI